MGLSSGMLSENVGRVVLSTIVNGWEHVGNILRYFWRHSGNAREAVGDFFVREGTSILKRVV